MDHSASAQFMKRPRMNSVIVFPVHDSCLSPNKDDTAVLGCHFSGTSVIAVRMPAVLATLQEHHGVGVDVCPPYSLLFFQIHKPCSHTSIALRLKIMMIKSFTFKNNFFLSLFINAFLGLCWILLLLLLWLTVCCRYCLIDCYRDGACSHFRFSRQRAMMFLVS